jgi:hypothetical protein
METTMIAAIVLIWIAVMVAAWRVYHRIVDDGTTAERVPPRRRYRIDTDHHRPACYASSSRSRNN